MRRELKKRGVEKLKVVYSKEKPLKPAKDPTAGERGRESSTDISAGVPVSEDSTGISAGVSVNEGSGRRSTPGSLAFVPSVAGLIIAGEVVRDLCGIK
jgi:tRNA A37 threonylcarbamoyladenosine dehydratase